MQRYIPSIILSIAVIFGATACVPTSPQTTETTVTDKRAEKTGDGELRTGLAPIAKRYPQLATAVSIEWMSGTTGTSDLGPTTYWVDVVAVMPASEIDALLAVSETANVDAPELVPDMAARLPAGPFQGSAALDALFSAQGYSATVALDPATRTVALSGLFE